VALKSRVGQIVVPVSVTDAVMPGVVSLPHGWGHDKAGAQLRVAATKPGASVNDVTDDAFVDALSGTSSLSGVPVEVARVEV
jgi:anaerobic selenocysteine-containing dehydrogenase